MRAGIAPGATLDRAAIRSCTKLDLDHDQITAIQRAFANRLCIITDSPGTGKTTVVSVVLTALLKQNPNMAIHLCAPTGKAQARLKEAMQEQIKGSLKLADDDDLRTKLEKLETSTIHRLLKFNPGSRQFTYHAGNPIIADLLIVDEVSMVALPLMVKLLSALPDTYAACEQKLTSYLEGHSFRNYLAATHAEAAHTHFDTFRILCATRQGPCGVEHINQCVHNLLNIKTYGHGHPIMVTVNDYTHRLFNGDSGICLRDQETDSVKVWFSDYESPDEYRSFSIGELPAHTPVFAMTVHKAQGSGFDEVLLLLPPQENRVLTRELIYTGVTRAKKKCTLWANKSIFAGAIARPTIRMSALPGTCALANLVA